MASRQGPIKDDQWSESLRGCRPRLNFACLVPRVSLSFLSPLHEWLLPFLAKGGFGSLCRILHSDPYADIETMRSYARFSSRSQ